AEGVRAQCDGAATPRRVDTLFPVARTAAATSVRVLRLAQGGSARAATSRLRLEERRDHGRTHSDARRRDEAEEGQRTRGADAAVARGRSACASRALEGDPSGPQRLGVRDARRKAAALEHRSLLEGGASRADRGDGRRGASTEARDPPPSRST